MFQRSREKTPVRTIYNNYSMIAHNVSNSSINQSNSEAYIEHKRSSSQSEKTNFGFLANYNVGSSNNLSENSDSAWNARLKEKTK